MDGSRPALSRRSRLALAAPALALLGLFLAWPLAAILERSLAGGFPLDVLTSSATLHLLWFTTWQAAASTALTLVCALPLTWALARTSFRGRSVVEALALVPFVLPTIVVATGFLALLPERAGHTVWAILLAHVFFNVAVVIRVVGASWSALDQRLWEAATSLGARPTTRLRTVTLPLLRPALAAASSIVFLFSFTSFGVILVLGGPRFATLETEIYNQAVRSFDLGTAAVLALLQLVAVAIAATIAGRLERGLGAVGRRATRHPAPEGRMRLVVAGVVILSLGLLALPVLAVLRQSLQVGDGWGLDHFAALADQTPALLVTPWHAIVNSLAYATVATAIALAVGTPAAIAIARGGDALGVLVMLPLGASAAMLGFGFLLAFDAPPLDLRGSRAIVPLAQALVALPFVVRALVPPLRSLDPRLGEAAATLGASPSVVRRTVHLPLLGRALAAAGALAFAVSLGEFGATVFLARADAPTLPVAVFRFLGRPGADNVGLAAALCAVLVVLVATVSLAAERGLVRRSLR